MVTERTKKKKKKKKELKQKKKAFLSIPGSSHPSENKGLLDKHFRRLRGQGNI